ncbi:MAG TPA: hypothetical protein VFY93_10445 [Planctomycetota bacterium]|nr:hypothetical protein [Planctomycetota bacterium]
MSHEYGIGEYEVEVCGSWVGQSSGDSRTPYVEIAFNGEYGVISVRKYLTEKAYPYTEKDLVTLGWTPREHGYEFEELHQIEDDDGRVTKPSAILGARCRIKTKQEAWTNEKGEERVSVKIQFINPIGPRRQELPADERTKLLAGLRKNAIAWSGKPPAKPAPKPDDRKARTQKAAQEGAARAGSRSQRLQGVTGGDDGPPEPAEIPEDPPGDDWDSNPRF